MIPDLKKSLIRLLCTLPVEPATRRLSYQV